MAQRLGLGSGLAGFGKVLPCELKDLSLIPRNHKKRGGEGCSLVIPGLGRQRQEDAWNYSLITLIGGSMTVRDPVSKTRGGQCPRKDIAEAVLWPPCALTGSQLLCLCVFTLLPCSVSSNAACLEQNEAQDARRVAISHKAPHQSELMLSSL